ncbi:insulinase family protein, partial [Candidatus Sumerlaeota bacterium]|nr:insulinase family protein [Candidatus Sumerlaeota bacterium]
MAVLYGGLQFYGPENAGRELLLLETIDKGSAKFSKEEVNRQLAITGASLAADARPDYSVFSLRTLGRDFEKNFAVFADALTHPLLKEEEVKLALEQRLTAIKQQEETPDAYISILASRNFYQGHPYEVPPSGTEKSVAGVTAEELKRIHDETVVRSRVKLFIVGNVEKAKAESLVREGFKDLPVGLYTPKPQTRKNGQKPRLLAEKLDLPTNYIFGCFDAPSVGDADFPAMQVALSILDDRLFEEVRTKRNLTYAVSAQISSRRANYGVLYVTAVKPNATIEVMFDTVDKFVKEGVTAKEMQDKAQEMITGNLIKNQTNASQAAALALYDAAGLGWQAEAEALDKIAAVTPDQVKAVAEKYLKNFSFAALGDPAKVDKELFTSK